MMLDEMRAFALFAEAGSIHRVAARLLLTQSAVTRQIQRLESALGTALLDRTAKPPKLTPVGWTALERCRRILQAVDDLRTSTSVEADPAGVIRIGIGNALAESEMAVPLVELGRRFARLNIHIVTDWTPVLLARAAQGLLDVVVTPRRAELPLPAGVSGKIIGEEKLLFVTARAHNVPGGAPLQIVGKSGWVVKPTGCGARDTLRSILERASLPLDITAEVHDEHLQLSLIARGLGAGLVSQRSLLRHPQRNEVDIVAVPGLQPVLAITVVRAGFLGCLSRAVEALESDLARRFGPNGTPP